MGSWRWWGEVGVGGSLWRELSWDESLPGPLETPAQSVTILLGA